MRSVTYGIIQEIHSLGGKSRTSFGIATYAAHDIDGTATIIASVSDISGDLQRLSDFTDTCNRLELSPVHLYDVIEDFIF